MSDPKEAEIEQPKRFEKYMFDPDKEREEHELKRKREFERRKAKLQEKMRRFR